MSLVYDDVVLENPYLKGMPMFDLERVEVLRGPQAVLPLLWEFPGGRVRDGESDLQALVRTLEHRVGVVVEPREVVLEVWHEYPTYTLVMCVYRCQIASGTASAVHVHDLAWVHPDDFDRYEFPGADQTTVEQLVEDLT